MPIALKRIYDPADAGDGCRVLVDRLWPRGIARGDARLDLWLKEVAPSDELRQWFHEHPSRWGEFRRRYLHQLSRHREELRPLAEKANREPVTLLFASRDLTHNNAVVVKQYLAMLAGR